MKKIKLSRGFYTSVDSEDYEFLNQWKWSVQEGRHTKYAVRAGSRKIGKPMFLMHRVLMEAPKNQIVDHINGNGLDNRKENLRLCTNAQNIRNSKKRIKSSSIYKGVSWDRGAWVAEIHSNRKKIYIGRFKNERHAAMARDIAAATLHGRFANLNFPDSIVSL